MGDFNLPKVDWQSLAPTPDCKFHSFYRECLEVFNDCLLEQTVTSPTRGKHILDLFLPLTLPLLIVCLSYQVLVTMT